MHYPSYQNMLFEIFDRIAFITLNRPHVHNAVNTHVLRFLSDCFEKMESDDEVRVIILRGTGGKTFCAETDIDEIKDNGPVEQGPYQDIGRKWFRQIETIRKSVIASIEG